MKDIYAFLEPSTGPNNIRGVCLHYISSVAPKCGFAEGQNHWTPNVDWWASARAFWRGDGGFSAYTIDKVREEYPNMIIFPDRNAAVRAWSDAAQHPDVMRLYSNAVDELLKDCEHGNEDWVEQSIQRGRHWLFAASHVLHGEASALAWKAHMVFYK